MPAGKAGGRQTRMSATAVRPQGLPRRDLSVAIVGAGFGGIAAAIELRRHGIDDVTILERAPELGGTWYYNSYPGAACDVPSHLYSFSYAQRRDWSRLCSPQRGDPRATCTMSRARTASSACARRAQTVTACAWDEQTLPLDVGDRRGRAPRGGRDRARHRASCTSPHVRRSRALETSPATASTPPAGTTTTTSRASASAVVGTGASAVQFVPEIAAEVAQLTVFQRTGQLVPAAQEPAAIRRCVRAAIERLPRRAGVAAHGSCSSTASR